MMGLGTSYAIHYTDKLIAKLEEVFEGKNNLQYTIAKSYGAKFLAEACFGTDLEFGSRAESVKKYEPEAFELLTRLDNLYGSSQIIMKAPTHLLIASAKMLKGDSQ